MKTIISTTIPDDLYEQLKDFADEEHNDVSSLVKEAVLEHIQRLKRKKEHASIVSNRIIPVTGRVENLINYVLRTAKSIKTEKDIN